RRATSRALPETAVDVVDHHLLEIGGDRRAAPRDRLLAVDKYRRRRALASPRKRNTDVGVRRFAWAVDDAAHNRDVERLDTGILLLPLRHRRVDEALNVAGKLLERGRGGAPTARAGRDQRHEGAEAHGLQQLLRDLDLERAIAAGLGRERDANGIADPLLQQDAHRRGRRDDALRADAGLGEAEVQRVVGTARQVAIDRDQAMHRGNLRRQDDAVARQADLLGPLRRQERRLDHRLARHFARVLGRVRARVLVHQMGEELLVERAPVGAVAHRLAVLDRGLNDRAELTILLFLEADI